jgi:hypothetical protein
MNTSRGSWITPIAVMVIGVGLILFLATKISGTGFAVLIICTGLVLLVWFPLQEIGMAVQNIANSNLKAAEAVVCVGQQQITFSKDEERRGKRELLILIVSLIILSLEVVRLMHGH